LLGNCSFASLFASLPDDAKMAKIKSSKRIKAVESLQDGQIGARLQQRPIEEPAESAFFGLREQIEAQLAKSIKQPSTKKMQKANGTHVPVQDPEKAQSAASEEVVLKGKKRDRSGNVLAKSRSVTLDQESHTKTRHDPPAERTLEQEMRELGGSAEDLELILAAESESEMEGGDIPSTGRRKGKNQEGMEKGIQNILKEIALAQGKKRAAENEADDAVESDRDEGVVTAASIVPGVQLAAASIPSSKPTKKPLSSLKCELRPDWYNASYLHQTDSTKQPQYTLSNISLNQLRDYACDLLETENQDYMKTQQHSSSNSFYNTVIASGTLSDKISALTLAVQESPLHNVKALETLIGLAKKRSRAQAVDVLRALKDLFAQGSLLPGDRRLYTFAAQPGLVAGFSKLKTWNLGEEMPHSVKHSQLMAWYYEDWLKEQYFEILKTLEVWCNDEIEFSKSRAVNYVYELLKEKPEQESNLLRLLINKLGDPIKKIASQTSYLLMQLLGAHPAMKETVIAAIEADFLFRPGQSMHGKYYAIVTLNQTALSTQEEQVAVKLLDIYFSLFGSILKPTESASAAPADGCKSTTRGERRNRKTRGPEPETKEMELREKFIAAILTGVNRAYPYTDTDGRNLSAHLDTLFKITHSSNFNTSIQAMMLIQQMSSSHQASSDRFYRTLYESLLDARLISSSKQQLYLNLLHRSLKADLNIKRVKAFVKRILQILSLHEASFICAAFFLLKDLENTFPALGGLVDQPEEHDEEEETFRDVDEEESEGLQEAQQARLQKLEAKQNAKDKTYDGRKRDPEHSHADNSCAWELLPFLAHFHPAVSLSADNLSRHFKMPGKPDLKIHTLIHFLDRFVYKNPKLASINLRGSSIMQPMASSNAQSALIGSSATLPSLAVNTDRFRNQTDDQVSAEDVFFHQYFSSLGREKVKAKTSVGATGSEDGSIGDEDEDAVWKAMMDSAPDLEGVEDSDQDLSMSDLESDLDEAMVDSQDEAESIGDADVNSDEIGGVPIFDDGSHEELDVFDGGDISSEEAGLEPQTDAVGRRKSTPQAAKSKSAMAREKRKQMKGLPMFASAEDYAKMLEDDEDEDLG
jgi:ribosome biogenesis protein MAK21